MMVVEQPSEVLQQHLVLPRVLASRINPKP